MKNAMNFRPVGLMLLFCLIPLWAFAQSVMVKGVVKDTSGEAIIGASVLEKGTTNGTITDFDGNFALNVSKNAVLVVSFVGYKNEEIPVAGKSSLKITLKEDSKALEEVVVIGYGSARKSDVTGSIASVGGEKLREMPATNITYALQNRVAGVDMSADFFLHRVLPCRSLYPWYPFVERPVTTRWWYWTESPLWVICPISTPVTSRAWIF